ncbi:MFS transporter, partial [Aeromonas jandaei]
CTYFINFVIAQGATHEWLVNDGWRYMFLGEVVPAILLLVASFFIPESPRWLVMKGDEKQAKKILLNINGESEAKNVFQDIKSDIAISHDSREGIFKSGLGKILFIAVALAMLSQATGINVIIYYATVLLNSIGTSDGGPSIWSSVFFQNVLIGVTVFVSAFFPIFTVERWGRRPLMIWGSLGVAVTIITVGLALFFGHTGIWLLAVLLVYLAIFGATLGPLPWILMSEICPNSHRNKIVAISTLLFWFANVIVAQTFPMMNDSVMLKEVFKGSFPFFVYGGFSMALAYICHRYLPETKGKSIEQVYQNLLPGKIS